jgi:hypothetical protein
VKKGSPIKFNWKKDMEIDILAPPFLKQPNTIESDLKKFLKE